MDDLISRQAAVESVECALAFHSYAGGIASKAIMNLPSAQPKIIRCKDCKHRYVDGDNVRFNVCELNHNKVQSDNWYCADAERKER